METSDLRKRTSNTKSKKSNKNAETKNERLQQSDELGFSQEFDGDRSSSTCLPGSTNGKVKFVDNLVDRASSVSRDSQENGEIGRCKSVEREWLVTAENENEAEECQNFIVNIQFDFVTILLFVVAFCTRFYRLSTPNNIVFDELHYGKYVSMYMRNTFFFDQHPPLGKQLIAGVASLVGYDGNFTYSRIGSKYSPNVPIFWLRFVPALCGSILSPVMYKLLLEARLNRWTALLGGLLIIFDNSLLTQSRFVLMESMLLLFSSVALLFLLRFQKTPFATPLWFFYGAVSASFFTFAVSVKYVGFLSCCLGFFVMCRYLWDLLYDADVSDWNIILQTVSRWMIFTLIPIGIYVGIFYVHLSTLHKAGPHDNVMTSAFQASLDGGLASITKGQPLVVMHGSQITLRHTHGRPCWLHSHAALYPVRYKDKRGSSHQQQVTCYSFKDVNNWWIVKRPERDDLSVDELSEPIRHGDVVQLVHGITSRALNSHDVAAPVTPQCQEISCYIDYEISMPGELLWRVEIVNRDAEGPVWHAIRSEIRLVHVATNTVVSFTGRQLPDWGFNQHEVAADRVQTNKDSIWNVEEHRYTTTESSNKVEQQLLKAEMIPTVRPKLSFWQKFIELQTKMLWHSDQLTGHMYSSEPTEWPLMDKGIAYWVDSDSNGQIHLIGNILIWYTGSAAITAYVALFVFYLIRRRRLFYDIPESQWVRFRATGELFLGGYLVHYVPYYFVDRVLFLHNYLPAFLFKVALLCFVIDHADYLIRRFVGRRVITTVYRACIVAWVLAVFVVYRKFLALSYGIQKLTAEQAIDLRWKDSWDLILHKDLH